MFPIRGNSVRRDVHMDATHILAHHKLGFMLFKMNNYAACEGVGELLVRHKYF
jgi:hypothetical protein